MKSKLFRKSLVSMLLAGSVALSGCASTGSSLLGSSANNADPRLTEGTDAKLFSASGLQACAAAAGVGVVGCMLSGSSNKTACAVIAGIGACGVAIGANYYFDQRRAQYANTSERLKLMSDDVKLDTEKVIARTATAQKVIDDDKQKIAQIKRDIASKKIDSAKVEAEIYGVDQNISILRNDLANMRKKISDYEQVAELERNAGGEKEVRQVELEIAQMTAKVDILQQEVDGLYNQRSAITLG